MDSSTFGTKAAEITQYASTDVIGENLVDKSITDEYKDSLRSVLAIAVDGIEIADFKWVVVCKLC